MIAISILNSNQHDDAISTIKLTDLGPQR